jgi:hypothetical protein
VLVILEALVLVVHPLGQLVIMVVLELQTKVLLVVMRMQFMVQTTEVVVVVQVVLEAILLEIHHQMLVTVELGWHLE